MYAEGDKVRAATDIRRGETVVKEGTRGQILLEQSDGYWVNFDGEIKPLKQVHPDEIRRALPDDAECE